MKTLEEQCSEICDHKFGDELRYERDERLPDIAKKLANLLLEADAVNIRWPVKYPSTATEGIVNFLDYMDDDLRDKLLAKGLDLNKEYGNGVLPFTWFIGNAQNELVSQLLTSAAENQTLEQRLVWINKIDSMTRQGRRDKDIVASCFGLFSSTDYAPDSDVKQTPLQLTIAKGYTNKSGGGRQMNVSNLQIAEQLLRLGADQQINYQEPTRGNTALHIAYARRDYDAIKLLIKHGASQNIHNKLGETPADMLALSFNEAEKLMNFHTSPDGHPNTFRLEQEAFENAHNLQKIQQITSDVKLERQLMEIRGRTLNTPNSSLQLSEIESALLQGQYDLSSSLVNTGLNPQNAMKLIQHRINLLKFIIEDGSLHLQGMEWGDYITKRKAIDDKYNGSSNPYMYDINEEMYVNYQNLVNSNKHDISILIETQKHEFSGVIRKLEKGMSLLEKIMFTEAIQKEDAEQITQRVSTGIDVQRKTQWLQEELDALGFKKTIGRLAMPLYTGKITWDEYYDNMRAAYSKAGGLFNNSLPSENYPLDKRRYVTNTAVKPDPAELKEVHDLIEKGIAEIDKKILMYEQVLTSIKDSRLSNARAEADVYTSLIMDCNKICSSYQAHLGNTQRKWSHDNTVTLKKMEIIDTALKALQTDPSTTSKQKFDAFYTILTRQENAECLATRRDSWLMEAAKQATTLGAINLYRVLMGSTTGELLLKNVESIVNQKNIKQNLPKEPPFTMEEHMNNKPK